MRLERREGGRKGLDVPPHVDGGAVGLHTQEKLRTPVAGRDHYRRVGPDERRE